MKWTRFELGPVQTNAYVVTNDKRDALILDPGAESEKLFDYIERNEFNPLAVLLTHAHFDHIGALEDVRRRWQIPVYLHSREADWLGDPEKNGSAYFPLGEVTAEAADELIRDEGELKIASFRFEIFETPGHSPGSVSYYDREHGIVFSGDALFAGSIGRTDLYGGDQQMLLKSITEKLLTLPDDTVVASGHGPETTIGKEKRMNPFL
ncbi:MAG TPA: MBL fold metallo-hydrolase [Bacillales bacterium]|nr:MBL fold metallo-hydrolase [Bacillales bacterium]